MRTLLLLAFTVSVLCACTEQERARSWGGTSTQSLPCGQKLTVATWKESNLWYLTRPMRADETPKTYSFKESPNWGSMEGTVVFTETRCTGRTERAPQRTDRDALGLALLPR